VWNRTCRLPEPAPPGDLAVEPAWPALHFQRPVWFGAAPDGSARRFVVEQDGRIRVFDDRPDVDRADVFLSLDVSRAGNEEGLLGLAFHPNYAENGRFFVYYSAAGPRRSILAEYRRDPADPRVARPDTAKILLEIPEPYANHNGGNLVFGPDGYLYVGLGDGGSAGDPQHHAQDTGSLLGKMLRLDVDASDPVCGTPYGIPATNPFAAGRCSPGAGGRAEVWAWGLRNPWRFSFDRSTGELWAGDVGQDTVEEVDVIRGGRNYGWREVEGDRCYVDGCDPSRYEAPVYAYPHSQGRSITGGVVYRGTAFPELWGAYLFADYDSQRVWALRRRAGAAPDVTLLTDADLHLVSIDEDPSGEPVLVTFGAQSLVRLARRDAAPAAPIPRKLSETGCFADLARLTPAPGVVPYDVAAPLWSDGAGKRRLVALPPGTKMTYRADGSWDFPPGTVLVKTFELDGAPVETRLLRRGTDDWRGFTYRWRGADADLLDDGLTATTGAHTWEFPARAQCDQCHTVAGGGALGPTTRQLNHEVDYGGVRANQLQALADAGYVDLPAPAATLPRAPAPDDESAPVADRARALLDANCAMCHRPGGPADAQIDLRAETPLAAMGVCDVPPAQGDLNIAGARLVAPGAPDRSVLLQRMLRRGTGQMPPLATHVVDERGAALVKAWIQELNACR
jgi:uncharacterized repeat protein (TIGR03806 family)